MQPMPMGDYSMWLVDSRTGIGKMAIKWLEWEAFQHGIHTPHEYNTEKQIGPRVSVSR